MSLRYLLIATAFLIALCGADVSEIKPEKIDLPFNDLLPPLQDETSSTSTTSTTTTLRTTRSTTTTTTTLATKPTKKSYYTKPAQPAKEDKVKASSAKQDIQLLSLDLLPPFEDEPKPAEAQTLQVEKTEPSPVVKVTPPPTPKPAAPQPVIRVAPLAAPKPVIRVPQPAAPRPAVRVLPPAYSVHPAPPAALPTHASVLGSGFQSRFANYFLTSTPRPRRGPLPTITPFPHHVRL